MKPILQALVLADHVYQDRSGKMIICGTFAKLFLQKPPDSESKGDEHAGLKAIHPSHIRRVGSPYVYIRLTEVRGEAKLALRYVDLSNNKVLVDVTIAVKSDDPLASLELPIPYPMLPHPHFGCVFIGVASRK